MKKLLTLAAVALAATVSQAALISWGNVGASSALYGLDGTTKITAANAEAWGLTLTLMKADGTPTASSTSSINAMTAGQLQNASWTYTYGTDAQNGDEFYIKALMTVDGTTYEMNIYADQANKKNFVLDLGANPNNTSTATFTWESGAYGGSMWTAQSVPEPTSGLLLLLGVAGLALRRKRV